MKPLHALIGVTMLVLFGESIANFFANHAAEIIGFCLIIFAGIFIYSVKTSK